MSALKNEDIRQLVHKFFAERLERFEQRLDKIGFSERSKQLYSEQVEMHEQRLGWGFDWFDAQELSESPDILLHDDTVVRFRPVSGLKEEDWSQNEYTIWKELHKGQRDFLKEALERAKRLETYGFEKDVASPVQELTALGQATDVQSV